MKTKKFTLLQLIAIAHSEVRVSTSSDDIQAILSHIFNVDPVMSVQDMVQYVDMLKNAAPAWYAILAYNVKTLYVIADGDFMRMLDIVRYEYADITFDIPKL